MNREEYFAKVAEYKLLAKHEVGQNFLIDSDACEKIVLCIDYNVGDKVLEIGSGAGSLSFFLNENNTGADLIDIDESLVLKLQGDFADGNVHPKIGNALKWPLETYNKIIGNLPYYITTGILEKVLLNAKSLQKAVFMIQKEAFVRLIAKINTEDYSPLHVLMAYRCQLKREFNVPRTSFSPAPHVDSTVFSVNIINDDIDTAQRLYKLVSGLFLNRRKTIYNNLGRYLNNADKANEVLSLCHIDPKTRPQNIDLNGYLSILEATK